MHADQLIILPKGTHDYAKLIRPAELARYARDAKLQNDELIGMHYNPFSKKYTLGPGADVNYLMRTTRTS